jgi:two-component system, LuxR family, sensor kinase FixL
LLRRGIIRMSWVTVIWSMLASACLTLGLLHGLVWRKQKSARGSLMFCLLAAAAIAMGVIEQWMMHAGSTAEFGTALRWIHLPGAVVIFAIVGFIRTYLHAGRPRLGWTICGLRLLALGLNFVFHPNLNFREISGLRPLFFLGETVVTGIGIPNPWMIVGQASIVLLIVFIIDAGIAVWRRGNRRQAVVVGGMIGVFCIASLVQAVLSFWQILPMPITSSPFFALIVIAMGYELSRDVWQAAELSRRLGESEKQVNLAVESAQLGLWMRDLPDGKLWANEKCRALLGFAQGDPLSYDALLARVHPQDRESKHEAVQRALTAGGLYDTEYRVRLPDGNERWISAKGQAEFDGRGRPILMRGVCTDITARKQADLEAHRLRQDLAHASRVTMLGQLAVTLAHELNQPLGAILRNAEAAELFLQAEPPDLEEVLAILADIRRDDQRAGGVIDRMRALLRRRDLEMKPLLIGELAHDVCALVRPDAAARGVKVEMVVANDLPSVHGDYVQLQQVLLNLILNGMDALNGIPHDRSVSVHARSEGAHHLEIAVSDNGHGIPQQQLGKLFEPFVTTKPQGMGIGLAISRTILEAHGGSIRAANNPDRGATFRITLPVVKKADLA